MYLKTMDYDQKIANFPMFRTFPEEKTPTKSSVLNWGIEWYVSLPRSRAFKPYFSAKTVMSTFSL